ncbi:MAG TPA: hypothetical protein VLX68_05545 [Chitinivibrionales bacterium]|nr:hypothetical protein [Chitinivibrionales bacterium]
MPTQEYINNLDAFYKDNLSQVNSGKRFTDKLDVEQSFLESLGFNVLFEQQARMRKELNELNWFLITACKLSRGPLFAVGYGGGHEPHSKFKALIEALNNMDVKREN